MAIVEVQGVTKRFGKVYALKRASLNAPAHAITVVLGPSGSGKTTLLRIIAGIEEPDEGKIVIDGQDVTRLPPWERRVAMVFQEPALLPHMTVVENLVFFGAEPQYARELASLLHIDHLLYRKPSELSGGELQRAAIAVALSVKPRILLLDEPFSNLDQPLREELRGLVRAVQRSLGVTIIHVTHDQDEALELGDWLVVLMNGGVVAQGKPLDLYYYPPSPMVASFLGHNIICLDGKLASIAPEFVEVEPGGEAKLVELRAQRGRVVAVVKHKDYILKAYLHPRRALSLKDANKVNVVLDRNYIVAFDVECRREQGSIQTS